MCILFIAIDQHPDFPLIIAANRDEYYARPSKAMHRWSDKPQIFAGRDMQAGGTWLGINRNHQFAAVTNYRNGAEAQENTRSRGDLVTHYLEQSKGFDQFLLNSHQHYNPFNLVYGGPGGVKVWDHVSQEYSLLSSGFHSVSNGRMSDYWPKMSRGTDHLSEYIRDATAIEFDSLLAIMQDATVAQIDQLPKTGLDSIREQALSSIFICGDNYGTRTSTLLLFSQTEIQISEHNYNALGEVESDFQFMIDASFFS